MAFILSDIDTVDTSLKLKPVTYVLKAFLNISNVKLSVS